MDALDLVAKLTMDSSGYESGLNNAKSSASTFSTGVKTAMGVGTAAVAGMATAVVGVSSAFASGISSVAEYTDHIDKQSQKMNMTAEEYQTWSAVMEHCGTSMDSLQSSMKTLANAAESGNEAFDTLGLSMEDIADMDSEELFSATITALQNMEDETERTYVAGQLLGRGATELGALLNTSAEDTQAMKDRVKELGGVMSDDAVKAGASFADSLQDMQTAFDGLKNSMLAEFLPAVTTVMDGLTEIFAGDTSTGLSAISEGVSDFADKLNEELPEIAEVGSGILTSLITSITQNSNTILTAASDIVMNLATAIVDNAPQLISSAADIILQLINGIVQELPQVATAAIDIIVTLANALSENVPQMIPTIVDVVLQIADTLIDNVPEIIDAALTLMLGLVDGITEAIPDIIEAIPELISSIIDALTEAVPDILDAGVELLSALVDALPEVIEALNSALPQIINAVVDFFSGDGFNTMVEAYTTLFVSLSAALPDIISALTGMIPTLVDSMVTTLVSRKDDLKTAGINLLYAICEAIEAEKEIIKNYLKAALELWVGEIKAGVAMWKTAGSNLLEGLWNGIGDKVGWLTGKITSLGSTVLNKLKSVLGIASPSKKTKEMGKYLAEGLGIGWEDEIDNVKDNISKDLNFKGSMDLSSNASLSTAITASSEGSSGANGISINLYNTTEIDGKEIKKESYKYTVEQMGNETRAVRVATGGYY